ncbi:sensor histidine kinase [Prolixibacter denitrificans]|uniref:Histidine kinase n=1 Tax=Prolixibacter denitrificans TaxID=1541063 RepID=A0A2P8CAD8_9BACT|nr:histidine kinase [Prolixibacter denitrificans]PSK81929.1 histidine kinase [Prolixibacter denitrificans]GET22526.1 sensor histidine kinase [Prolixibacter denitrificans]
MFQGTTIKLRSVLLHTLFWVAVWFFYVYFFSYKTDNITYVTWFASFLLPVTMAVTYFVVYFLIPRYLLTKKYWRFALYGIYTFILSTYLIVVTIMASFIFLSNIHISDMPLMSRNYAFILILVYLIVGIISSVSLLNNNFRIQSRNRELEKKILEAQLQFKEQELEYLKKQIHPHFLFNTLNTLYGFALKQSKQTPEIILKLSNILDYILYQVNKPRVNLSEEILHVKEYIELEKIRFQDTLKVSIQAAEIDNDVQIAPMLLIPFVENAFKHGNIVDGFLTVDMTIVFKDGQLRFHIQNTTRNHVENNENGGIGLENIRKRLELNYPERHELKIEKNENWYTVDLTITDLKS